MSPARVLRREPLRGPPPGAEPEVEVRALSDYDTACSAWTEGPRDGRPRQDRSPGPAAPIAFLTRALKAPTLREAVPPAGRAGPDRVLDS